MNKTTLQTGTPPLRRTSFGTRWRGHRALRQEMDAQERHRRGDCDVVAGSGQVGQDREGQGGGSGNQGFWTNCYSCAGETAGLGPGGFSKRACAVGAEGSGNSGVFDSGDGDRPGALQRALVSPVLRSMCKMTTMARLVQLVAITAIALCSSVTAQKYRFGVSGNGGFALLGDVNGDRHPDFAVGSTPTKTVAIWSGKNGDRLIEIKGPALAGLLGLGFGSSVAALPDLDRDGAADFAVGTPDDTFDQQGTRVGSVRAYSSRTGKQLWMLAGTSGGDGFGASLAAAGDVDKDGSPDLLVGVPGSDSGGQDRGLVLVLTGSGGTIRTRIGAKAGHRMGYQVAGAGDINKDGYADYIVVSGPGLVDVFSGKDTSQYTKPLLSLSGGWGLGESVANAGDVNGDGYPDIIAGAPLDNNSRGLAKVFSGKDGSILHTFTGSASGDQLGKGVCGIGDVNRDGFDDVLVGAPNASVTGKGFVGYARAFSGRDGTTLFTVPGFSNFSNFAHAMSPAGDMDQDGVADFMVAGGIHKSGFVAVFSSPHLAGYSTFGSGCAGTASPPTLTSLKPPVLGSDFVLELGNMKGNQAGMLATGQSNATWMGKTLPLDLAFVGMRGCKLYCDLVVQTPFNSGSGKIQWKLRVPNDSSLIDLKFYNQLWVADPGANVLGIAVSNAGKGVAGS